MKYEKKLKANIKRSAALNKQSIAQANKNEAEAKANHNINDDKFKAALTKFFDKQNSF